MDSTIILTPDTWRATGPLSTLATTGRPVEVDLGCGKGRFLAARARANPAVQFIGIDRSLVRLRKVEKKAGRLESPNILLLHAETSRAVEELFPAASITTFYIFFPDPWPKRRHHRRRTVTGRFLAILYERLIPGGILHVATDHGDYFREITKLVYPDTRWEEIPAPELPEEERTDFELTFRNLNQPIYRYSCRKRFPVPV